MSLDKFQMSVSLAAEMYKDSLVALDTPQLKSESLKQENLNYLGNNQKKILVIVEDKESLHLNDTDTAFLTGILNACKLNFNDIALFNTANHIETDFTKMQQHFNPKYVLLFGVEPKSISIGSDFEYYTPGNFNNIVLLNAASLKHIAKNVDEKKLLWNALKTIFAI